MFIMCKKNELIGSVLMAFGAGLLISLLFSSEFITAILGVAFLVCGLFFSRRR